MNIPKAPSGHFTLLYFAAATSYTRRDYDFLPAPLAIHSLFDVLEQKYPGMKGKVLDSSAVTVNLEYVDLEEESTKTDAAEGALTLKDGDEVAIIPPVSSG